MSQDSTQQLVHASVHQLLLAPLDTSPVYDGVDTGPLLSVTDGDTALIIQTGCADGPVLVEVHVLKGAPDESLGDAWEVSESVSLLVDVPLHLSSPTWTELHDAVLIPVRPGPHRVRVSARGRGEHYDEAVAEPTEHYLVEAWPEPSVRPRELHLDDHVWS